jgi:cyanophycinase-like exopeptidase
MTAVEGMLLDGRPPRFVQVPTAAAPEGPASLERWLALGREQAARLGVEAVPVLARNREEADSDELAALVEGAGLVYLSGGNPPYLAQSLAGTRLWEAIRSAWEGGAALAGCSAGAIALTSWVPDIRHPDRPPLDGLGAVPQLRVIPHFDRFVGWMPDLVGSFLTDLPEGVTLVGVDEDTALVHDAGSWVVHGRQQVWVLTHEGRIPYAAGEEVPI